MGIYKPRELDLDWALKRLVQWTAEAIVPARALVIGLSGTDSALAFVVCHMALRASGRDPSCLVGIHFGQAYLFEDWFRQFGPVEVTPLPESPLDDDVHRWAFLQSYGLKNDAWVVGSRNRLEDAIGDFSNASMVAALQPIMPLWKSEVLALCEKLDMPRSLIGDSCLGDMACACHRPGLMGRLEQCEYVLHQREAWGSMHPTDNPVLQDAIEFIDRFIPDRDYKRRIPYVPSRGLLIQSQPG